MSQRIWALSRFFLQTMFTSATGVIYLVIALAYWYFFFPPDQQTPDFDNYVLIIGGLGAALSFLIALSMSARANEASNYPFLVRLPSKVEFLTAVLLSTLITTTILQLIVALLALFEGPELSLAGVMEIPPIWIAVNLLSAVLAIHASDFVTTGWSRVYIFGILAIFLFGQNINEPVTSWLAERFGRLGSFFFSRDIATLAGTMNKLAAWLTTDGTESLQRAFGFIFWPFRAISDAVIGGFFNPTQALAPAILVLYATILFMLAADLFANKDIDFIE
jgi:hypothetical protein